MAIKVPLSGSYDINIILNNGANDAGVSYSVSPLYANVLSVHPTTGLITPVGLGLAPVEARDTNSVLIKRVVVQIVPQLSGASVNIFPQSFSTVLGSTLEYDAQLKANIAEANAKAASVAKAGDTMTGALIMDYNDIKFSSNSTYRIGYNPSFNTLQVRGSAGVDLAKGDGTVLAIFGANAWYAGLNQTPITDANGNLLANALTGSMSSAVTYDSGFAITLSSGGTNLISGKVTGETYNKFNFSADGFASWGAGTTVQDTFLSRSGVGQLAFAGGGGLLVDSFIKSTRSSSGFPAYITRVTGDTFDRFLIKTGGTLEWGTGIAAADVNLYRNGTNAIKTDGHFGVAGILFVGADANLYRSAANILKTDDSFIAVGDITGSAFYGSGVNLTGVEKTSDKGAANGYASLGADGKIPTSQLGAIAITDTFVVASQSAMLTLTVQTGDVAVRTDLNKSYILKGTDPTILGDWQELLTPTDTVMSVNGQTGAVTLTTSEVSEGSSLYFTNSRAQSAVDSTYIQTQLTGDITTHNHNTNNDVRYAKLASTNDFIGVQNITRSINGLAAGVRLKNLDLNSASVGSGIQVNLANTSGTDIFAGAIYIAKDGTWDTTAANQDAKMQFFLAKDGTVGSKGTLDSNGKLTVTSLVGDGALVTNVSAAKAPTQAFAQLWAVGLLTNFTSTTVVDHYVNSGGAKTLGKIVISSDTSGTTGAITVDILKKDTTGGTLTTLFTTVAKPTLTANGGLTWSVVTGAGLPDVVAIPDGAVLVLQINGAPIDAENIKVELYEV